MSTLCRGAIAGEGTGIHPLLWGCIFVAFIFRPFLLLFILWYDYNGTFCCMGGVQNVGAPGIKWPGYTTGRQSLFLWTCPVVLLLHPHRITFPDVRWELSSMGGGGKLSRGALWKLCPKLCSLLLSVSAMENLRFPFCPWRAWKDLTACTVPNGSWSHKRSHLCLWWV